MKKIDLSGSLSFCLDQDKLGIEKGYYSKSFTDTINLPTTVSEAMKSAFHEKENTYFLTDPYLFEGYSWYSREIDFSMSQGKEINLVLERTRVSHVWLDDSYVGSDNSLCTSHRFNLTSFIKNPTHKLTILVDNTSYPVKGGHMTSQDTQTNWNGITGGIFLEIRNTAYLSGVTINPDIEQKKILINVTLNGAMRRYANVTATDADGICLPETLHALEEGINTLIYPLGETAKLWSEHSPNIYKLKIELEATDAEGDRIYVSFGLRDFTAVGKYFKINGKRTFLRGKHDGLIFPMTGYAPTDLESWLKVMATAKNYGINHYRFHTCCPPEAAFTAADLLGIYMEPELPFWGTITVEGDENHDEAGQQYLIKEGVRILEEFGNHPSFVMMSLGNELWGSKERLNEILGRYKKLDNRHLYTQGSNNFQFVPCVLENEDFFCGVRFSKDRLFRGSYAMCDAPQGHIQMMSPNTDHNYNEMIRPRHANGNTAEESNITIQYGTDTKTVKAEASEELIPQVPVVSHEIGQYAMYPDFSEIDRYVGVLKARNLEVFRKRLDKEGMLQEAERFFLASGNLAVQCYKAELETALRSSELAGFQILDLQDFTGQGTALVGILNSFMESKGIVSVESWRQFCSDTVILAELPKLVFKAGESVLIGITLAHFSSASIINPEIKLSISYTEKLGENTILMSDAEMIEGEYSNGIFNLNHFEVEMPIVTKPTKLLLEVQVKGLQIKNRYDLWIYPEQIPATWKDSTAGRVDTLLSKADYDMVDTLLCKENSDIIVTDTIDEAITMLELGKNVLLFPKDLDETNSIEGTYCTDFWCYPMFRSISESMKKPVPIGTLGLLIDEKHPIFQEFPTEFYTTPQWYDIVSNSKSMILNETKLEPIVWTIDNFERNDRLGMVFELRVSKGKLLVCTSDLRELKQSLPARWMMYSMLKYISTSDFAPKSVMNTKELKGIFKVII